MHRKIVDLSLTPFIYAICISNLASSSTFLKVMFCCGDERWSGRVWLGGGGGWKGGGGGGLAGGVQR